MTTWRSVWITTGLLCALAFGGCRHVDVPLVGLDEQGNSVSISMPAEKYGKNLSTAIASVHESVIPALAGRSERGGLALRTVAVGAGVSAEVGIGPLKVGAFPRFRLMFTNSKDPATP